MISRYSYGKPFFVVNLLFLNYLYTLYTQIIGQFVQKVYTNMYKIVFIKFGLTSGAVVPLNRC